MYKKRNIEISEKCSNLAHLARFKQYFVKNVDEVCAKCILQNLQKNCTIYMSLIFGRQGGISIETKVI